MKIYYADGFCYNVSWHLRQPFEKAPGWGVVDVIQMDEANGRPYHQGGAGADYYIMRKGKIVGVDLAGMLDHVVNELGAVKVGRTIETRKYIEIRKKAEDDFK